MANRNVNSVMFDERNFADALRKHVPNITVMLRGARVTAEQIATDIDTHIALVGEIKAVRKRLGEMVQRQKKMLAANNTARFVVRTFVEASYGAGSKEYIALGFRQKKRKKPTAQQRAAAAAKSLATRKARHIMGKKQRKAIKAP